MAKQLRAAIQQRQQQSPHKNKRHTRENTDVAFLFYTLSPYTLFIQPIVQIANTTDMQTYIGYTWQHIAFHIVINAHHQAITLAQMGFGNGETILVIADTTRQPCAIGFAKRAIDGIG